MPVERLRTDHFSNDHDRAHRTARVQMEFVIENIHHLRKVDRDGRAEKAARSFLVLLKNGESLNPGQLSYADGIYEQTMKGAGFPSVNVHADKKRRSLKFG
jgi:hypothetical protein